MSLRRRDFIRLGSLGLAGAGLNPGLILSPTALAAADPADPVRDRILSAEFPFPYDDTFFECAERIYNVRRMGAGAGDVRANLHLLLKAGRTLDVRVFSADRAEGLPTGRVQSFTGVRDALDVELPGSDARRLHYQVQYREGAAPWRALSPKSFKLPNVDWARGDEIVVILLGDDHTFDDGDYSVPAEYAARKLNGDYVNVFMQGLRTNPAWTPPSHLSALRNGFTLAQALRQILAAEDPDFVINLGDTTGLGANYRWPSYGFPISRLTESQKDVVARTFWLRMRKMYSAITPIAPFHLCFGNHDGEEIWNEVRLKSREWRRLLFPMPTSATYPEGGHPDGVYHAFSWGADGNNRGGARFILLDGTGFVPTGVPPKTPEEWTLGAEQLAWFESLLRRGEKDWTFACFHHVLGGWPAGPDETTFELAYGRGPLFTEADYQGLAANPSRVEQVKLTDWALRHGLNGFLLGHDHVFHYHPIGKTDRNQDLVGVAVGSPKYVGESTWWSKPYWKRFYGPANGVPPAPPKFWGPCGITRLTLRRDEARFDYVVTGRTFHSNLPPLARAGMILESHIVANPPPVLEAAPAALSFAAVEGQADPPPAAIRVRNRGARAMAYQVRSDKPWLSASPEAGTSWGEENEITIVARISGLGEGAHAGIVTVESGAAGGTREIAVSLKLDPPPLYPPLCFQAFRRSSVSLFGADKDVFFSWKGDPRNRSVTGYRLYLRNASGVYTRLANFAATAVNGDVRVPKAAAVLCFALRTADSRGRESEPSLAAA